MIREKILRISETALVESMSKRYTNSLVLSGFILQKPKFNEKNCSFIIYQINKTDNGLSLVKTYSAIAFIPKIVEQLKQIKHCCFVVIYCTFEYNPRTKKPQAQAWKCDIAVELSEELDPPYQRSEL